MALPFCIGTDLAPLPARIQLLSFDKPSRNELRQSSLKLTRGARGSQVGWEHASPGVLLRCGLYSAIAEMDASGRWIARWINGAV